MNENPHTTPTPTPTTSTTEALPDESRDLSAMTLMQIEQAVDLLTTEAPDELVLRLLELTAALKRHAAELREHAEALAVAWIEANGDLVLGDQRFYAGHAKTTRCLDQRAAVEAALTAVAGDIDGFCQLLCSQALKHGACRGILPAEAYEQFFLTEENVVLKDGKAVKRLLKTNDAFNKSPKEVGNE